MPEIIGNFFFFFFFYFYLRIDKGSRHVEMSDIQLEGRVSKIFDLGASSIL